MRRHTRMGLALLGLALAAPALVWADGPPATAKPAPAPAKKPHKQGWGLFGSACMCPDCQRQRVKKRDGVDIPPPPSVPPMATVMPMPVVTPVATPTPTPTVTVMAPPTVPAGECEACQVQNGAVMMSGNGYVQGDAMVGIETVPGYTVVGGTVPLAEPSPIGVVQARPGRASTMPGPAVAQRRGQADPSVMPTSLAPDTIASPRAGRPHILTHLFGLDEIGKRSGEERERRERESHASIAYGPQNEPVNELPASVVYGKGR